MLPSDIYLNRGQSVSLITPSIPFCNTYSSLLPVLLSYRHLWRLTIIKLLFIRIYFTMTVHLVKYENLGLWSYLHLRSTFSPYTHHRSDLNILPNSSHNSPDTRASSANSSSCSSSCYQFLQKWQLALTITPFHSHVIYWSTHKKTDAVSVCNPKVLPFTSKYLLLLLLTLRIFFIQNLSTISRRHLYPAQKDSKFPKDFYSLDH